MKRESDVAIETLEQPPPKRRHLERVLSKLNPKEINRISDLIELGNAYSSHIKFEDFAEIKTNINLRDLKKILPELRKLDCMIGMEDIKKSLLNQLLYFLERLDDGKDTLHCCIYGNPGTGKTTIGEIIGKIYCKMGILSKGHFTVVKRDMLVAGYLGQTAIKTRKVLESCIGGVMFLDEAYQMSGGDRIDSFSKECLDTINQFLLEHRNDFICIIAGYRDEVERCFFSVNKGLERRFPWQFEIKDYTSEDLKRIFIKQVQDAGWKFENKNFEINFDKEFFTNNGGDTEILFSKIKIAHSKRIINLDYLAKKVITLEDIKEGMELYKKDSRFAKEKNENLNHMYL
jgi:replication-associated recombination protein RarA